MPLELYNTLTRKKEAFVPLEEGKVGMYNCGPTVYSHAHIGNFASFLLADLLRRYLEYRGYEVRQIMNITDVGHLTMDDVADAQGEDKLEKKAREEKKDPWEIARFYEEAFHEDRHRLNILDAHVYPRATEHIPEMIAMIEELLELGLAYQAGDQVYFEIAKFPKYGVLSGNTPEELLAGARVEEDPLKRSPLDFTLWKRDPKHIMQWDSPWGRGFPGWHIECSAMSRKYLGEVFDIHSGGEDNVFPHHECEIAQSSGREGKIFARYWLHRRHIFVEGKKMSKSSGNFFTVRDLLAKGYGGLEIRYALLSTHYRSHSNFTFEGLDSAKKSLRYFREFEANMRAAPRAADGEGEAKALARLEDLARGADERFCAALDDDLNVSVAFAEFRGFVHDVYSLAADLPSGTWTRRAGERALELLRRLDLVLGVLDARDVEGATETSAAGRPSEGEIERLIEERARAKARKDFAEADRIRDFLREHGIVIKDTPQGTVWHPEV